MSALTVDFLGELYQRGPGESLTIGREADVVVDDENPFSHARRSCRRSQPHSP